MSWPVDCANCEKQTLIEAPGDRCIWCGKSATKKEVIMVENKVTAGEGVVPPFPKKRKERRAYFEQNKEAIIADYYSMKLLDFFKRWRITTGRWLKLKIQWGVERKDSKRLKQVGKPAPKPVEQAAEDVTAMTEHERYLILLGYQQAVREYLRSGRKARYEAKKEAPKSKSTGLYGE